MSSLRSRAIVQRKAPVPDTRAELAERAPAPDEYVSWGVIAGLLRRRWPVIVAALALCVIAAVAYLAVTPPTYEAGTSLLIEEEPYNLPEIVARPKERSDLSTQMEVLHSAAVTEPVARELALRVGLTQPKGVERSRILGAVTVGDSTPGGELVLSRGAGNLFSGVSVTSGDHVGPLAIGAPGELDGVSFTLRPAAAGYQTIRIRVGSAESAARALQKAIRIIRPERNGNVVWIRHRSHDPELSARITNAVAAQYIASRIELAKAKVRTAVAFLRNEADTLRQQLLTADQDLHDFRRREGIVSLPAEASAAVSESAELQMTRSRLEAERTALERLVRDETGPAAAASPFRRLTAFPTLISNPVVSNLLRTLAELENERAELLVRRTPKDPDARANEQRIAGVDDQLRGMTLTYLAGLKNQVASLDGALSRQAAVGSRLPGKSMEEERLSRRPKVLGEVYALVETRLQEARIAESAADPAATVIDRAGIPEAPVWPRTGLILAVAVAVGLLIGGGVAWVRDTMDPSIHSRADVTHAAGAQVLGVVPHIRPVNGRGANPSALLPADAASAGAALEAYASLETNLSLLGPVGGLKSIALTSAVAREGKTMNAANLALSTARRGSKVLLIDADLRRGLVHRAFGLPPSPGLTDLLGGSTTLETAIRPVVAGPDAELHVLSAGSRIARHPAGLLRSDALRDLLQRLETEYDLIIVDTPPINLVSDAVLVSTMVDGVVLVARAGATDAASLTEAARHLRSVNAPLLGVLLNDIDMSRDGSYDHAYRYLDQAGAYATVGDA